MGRVVGDEEVYGNAWMSLLCDVDLEIRITNPSKEVRKIHGINPLKYFVLPGTNTRVPNEIPGMVSTSLFDIHFRPIFELRGPLIKIDEVSRGDIVRGTLVRRIKETHLGEDYIFPDFFKGRNEWRDSLIFKYEEFQEILSSARKTFLSELKKAGFNKTEEDIYLELSGDYFLPSLMKK